VLRGRADATQVSIPRDAKDENGRP
jgi:hypothetical protein